MSRATVLDLLDKLQPFFKKHEADRLWNLWLVGNRDDREWLEQLLEVEYSKRTKPLEKHVLLPPPPEDKAAGIFHLGEIVYGEEALYPFSLPSESALLQHAAIFGRSGAGKTNLVFKLIAELAKKRVPFWLFDWKRDYRPLLKQPSQPLFFTIGRAASPLPFNPLIPPAGCDSEAFSNKIADVIGRCFYVGHGVKALLLRGFRAAIQRWKQTGEQPTFQAVLAWLRDYQPKDYGSGRRAADWKESTIRALERLSMGEFGHGLNADKNVDVAQLIGRNIVFELDALDADQKAFFVESLLLWLREHRLARLDVDEKEKLRSVLVIEEAHNILKASSEHNVGESVLEVTLRETRSLGMGIVLLDQTPAFISKVALSNCFTTICFSLQGRANLLAAADALLLDEEQRDFLGQLPVGSAIVRMQDHWTRAFLLRVPYMAVKQAVVGDEAVTAAMKPFHADLSGYSTCSGMFQPQQPESGESQVIPVQDTRGLTEPEYQFIVDILNRPFAGMASRYKQLGLSTRHGNELRKQLEARGYIKVHTLSVPEGHVTLPELTQKAADELRSRGLTVKLNGSKGGIEHKYWVNRIAGEYREKGYQVTIEKPIGGGKRIDIEAVNGEERIAIEVETGKSDVKANVEKVRGYGKVFAVGVGAGICDGRVHETYAARANRHGIENQTITTDRSHAKRPRASTSITALRELSRSQ